MEPEREKEKPYIPNKKDLETTLQVLEITKKLNHDLGRIDTEGRLSKCLNYATTGLKGKALELEKPASCIFALIYTAQAHFYSGLISNGASAEQNIERIKEIIQSRLEALNKPCDSKIVLLEEVKKIRDRGQ
jgi:hypothetical protein